ncbi:MAG: hypothetical protein ACTSU2_09240 [Promethearchaeota archaeon]
MLNIISLNAWIDGISALILVFIGIIWFIYFLLKYKKEKKALMPLVALLGLLFGLFYSGPAVGIIHLAIKDTNLDPIIYAYLSYTLMPLTIVVVMNIGFALFYPKYRNLASIIYGLTAIPYYIWWFLYPNQVIIQHQISPGDLQDIGLSSVVGILTMVYLMSLLIILAGGFLTLYTKLDSDTQKRRKRSSLLLALGFILFFISGAIDSLFVSSLTIVARIIMILSYYMQFLGFKN